MRYGLTGTLVLALALASAPQAWAAMVAGDVKQELQTAIFHSGELAQRGSVVASAKLHIQHTINCLEGPSGADFKAEAGDPCQGMGNGILPDLKAAVAAGVAGAGKALKEATLAQTLAVQGLSKNTVNEVQPWAKVVSNHLKAALTALGS